MSTGTTTPAAPAADAPAPTITSDADELELLQQAGIDATPPKPAADDDEAPAAQQDEPTAATAETPVTSAETPQDDAGQADETAAPEGGTPPETPNEPTATAAQEKEKPAATAAAATKPTQPTADPDADALTQIRQQKQALLKEIEAADSETFDVIDDGQKVIRAQAKLIRLQEQERQIEAQQSQRQQQAKAYEDFWAARPPEYRKACEDVYARVLKQTGDANAALMEANVELRVLERTAAKPKPAAAASPAAPKGPRVAPPADTPPAVPPGAKVAPPAPNAVPPAAKPMSDEEELLANLRRLPGGLRGLRS